MWLDTALHQATGLHSFTPERQLRLLPVASHAGPGDVDTTLELLWQVCANLQRLSYPVVVLDGTARETEAQPGLAQLLGGMPWPEDSANAAGLADSLAVVPAARGLALLARRGSAAMQAPLNAALRSYALAVLYAPVELLAPLVAGNTGVPLVMMGPAAQGLVGAYRQLKHLALHAGLPACTVASVQPVGARQRPRQTAEALATLQRSAQEQLGLRVHTTTIAAAHTQDIQRLTLQLLENACTIDAGLPLPALHDLDAATPSFLEQSH